MHTHSPSFILALAHRVFGDPAEASDWLDRPCVQLGGHTPRDMLGSDDGVRRVEELLIQLDDDQRLGPG
jgi:putative toxin-antitoxin system antitoxin component (TIGR02293 family)